MKWTLQLHGNDFSIYEFTSSSGSVLNCKYNKSQGSLRLRYNDHHSVFLISPEQLANRKISLSNVYGSPLGLISKNLWRENTGTVTLDNSTDKIYYKLESHYHLIEITKGETTFSCDLNNVPHPGKQEHFLPAIIALSWLQTVHQQEIEKVTAKAV